jgi:hypothetical protein
MQPGSAGRQAAWTNALLLRGMRGIATDGGLYRPGPDCARDTWEALGRMRVRRGGACELRGIRLSASGIAHPQRSDGDVTAAGGHRGGARVRRRARRAVGCARPGWHAMAARAVAVRQRPMCPLTEICLIACAPAAVPSCGFGILARVCGASAFRLYGRRARARRVSVLGVADRVERRAWRPRRVRVARSAAATEGWCAY